MEFSVFEDFLEPRRIREGMINKITYFPGGMVESGVEICVVIHARGKDERTV
jgi:hypothetical protein